MAIKDLFKTSEKILSSATIESIGSEVESVEFVRQSLVDKDRFIPQVDFSTPGNFARYGLAEDYFLDSITHIQESYPYDGSLKEKLDWDVSASYLDKYILKYEYPVSTGYAIMGLNYGSIATSSNNYASYGSPNYISFKGGPHTASGGMIGKLLSETFDKSNIYDASRNRESNLEIKGSNGITLEFWLKKDSFVSGSESAKQVLFDVWNSASLGSSTYGRFRVELHPGISGEENYFYVELASGSSGLSSGSVGNVLPIGTGLDLLDNDWNHYSLSVVNSGSQMAARLYSNGALNNTIITGSSISLITGSMLGTIGSLLTSTSGSHGSLGWGKLSGSIDELRFWKTRRNAKQIGRYWFSQVGAGTNTDASNTSLGLYYKFNEGIVSTASVDPVDVKVLDYSGRISNGTWVGYVTGSRNTGSAMEENDVYNVEFADPIIYSQNPRVASYTALKRELGFSYDIQNNANIYGTFPEWITSDDREKGHDELRKLTQTMASFFDSVHLQIESLPNIKNANYINTRFKPMPFVSRFLESMGMVAPEIFNEAEILESLASRDDFREFGQKFSDIKNRIYQNIYNNLSYIYKSKGTEKSLRNLVRCFGIDDELIKINLYGDNVTYELKDNIRYVSLPKKYADFNNVDRYAATVYQHTSSAPSSRSFISTPMNVVHHGSTFQAEVIFPKKFEKDGQLFFDTPFVTASLYGAHTANCTEGTDKTWITPDVGNFQVFAIRPALESKNVSFMLSGTSGFVLPVLTSSIFSDVYTNEKWNFNVRIRPQTHPYSDGVSGSSPNNFIVEFNGYNTVADIINNSFAITGTISSSSGVAFCSADRRFFVGSHRTNFTGTVLQYCDVKISSLRVWMDHLSDETIIAHAKDASNYGTLNPYKNAYMTELSRSYGI